MVTYYRILSEAQMKRTVSCFGVGFRWLMLLIDKIACMATCDEDFLHVVTWFSLFHT